MKITMKPKMLQVKNTLMAFSTPIHQARFEGLEDFNSQLASRILKMSNEVPSRHNSNEGGWQSDRDVLNKLGEPFGSQLAKMFVDSVRATVASMVEMTESEPPRLSIDAWANVNHRGHSHALHIHPGCPWSGAYYVACEPDSAGEIYFQDPRTAALMNNHPLNPFNATNHVSIRPEPGVMVIFPSFLFHGVRPYLGEKPRIAMAFNLR